LLPLIASVILIISSGSVYMNLYVETPVSGIVLIVLSPFVIFSLVPLLGFGIFPIEYNKEMFFLLVFWAAVMWFIYNIIIIKRNGNKKQGNKNNLMQGMVKR